MASQNVLNLVDIAMVGTLGDAALAGVGIAGFTNFMATSFITGMAVGVQAMAARRLGEGRFEETAVPLNGGLLSAVAVALPWTIVLLLAAPTFFPYLAADPEVAGLGGSYFSMRLLGLAGVGMNFAFRGYWNAVHLSRLYMGTLLLMHSSNIFLNWILIFGKLGVPAMGVAGAGLGTSVATYIGTACYFILALRHARHSGFLSRVPDRATFKAMFRTSVPAGLQQFFFASGMTVFFWILGRVGTAELAAGNVLVNIMLVAVLPSIGFGLAAATLVGESLGAGSRVEASAWAWRVGGIAVAVVSVLALPMLVWPSAVLGVFIHDAPTAALAVFPLRLTAAMATVDAMGFVLMNSHMGAGNTRHVMVVSLAAQWALFLPAAYLLGPVLGLGLSAIWWANAAYRLILLLTFVRSWRVGAWAQVQL